MQDTAAISRTARVVDAIEQAERITQLISDARDIEPYDRPAAAQALDEAITATRQLPDLHELHASELAGTGSAEIDLDELGGTKSET